MPRPFGFLKLFGVFIIFKVIDWWFPGYTTALAAIIGIPVLLGLAWIVIKAYRWKGPSLPPVRSVSFVVPENESKTGAASGLDSSSL